MTFMNKTLKLLEDKLIFKIGKAKLLWKKQMDLAIFQILETYLTDKVLNGEEGRREELAEMQKQIVEYENFIKFIKKI